MQLGRNLLMDLEKKHCSARFFIPDKDSKFTPAFDALPADAGLNEATTRMLIPRTNSLMERWTQACRRNSWTAP
ncbi:hypothetical protein [Streptomyces sp. NPDC004533]|uniref:hypothetical protein n=1 Tax=Streptomyces sp. NPDC004533 TaxID=3154278 RepID=UPI0033B18DAD